MKQGGRPRRFEEQPDSPFGDALKEHLRRVKNFTQAELAREAVIPEKTLSQMVKGWRTNGTTLRRDLRAIIKVLHQKKALLTLEEANRLITTIPAVKELDERDPADADIIKLFDTPVARIERTLHIEEGIQGTLRNNAIVDHTQLFGVDTFLEKIKDDIFAPQAAWIISLYGEGGLGKTAIAYETVNQQLLVNFISVITRFVENAGVGYTFSKVFMDKAIRVYRQAGYSPIDLYLEKANLLRLSQLESVEREQSILEAKRYAEASGNAEMQLKVLLSCTVYYTEVSYYQKALQACQECEQLIQRYRYLEKYKPKLLTLFGMNYAPLFKYKLAKSYLLQIKAILGDERDRQDKAENKDLRVSTMDTIHHYLGRIAEGEGRMQEAMCYYVESYRYLQMFAHEPRARLAFYHLRMGELLISASLGEQARDHLLRSQEIFDAIQFSSSGRLQVSLAWAALYSKEGNYARAREFVLAAREEARNKHFPRGELWCLVKLFWLDLGHFHLYRAIVTFIRALATWRYGELRRNEGFRLFCHYLLQILATPFKLLKRTPHTVMGAGTINARLTTCICPEHQ